MVSLRVESYRAKGDHPTRMVLDATQSPSFKAVEFTESWRRSCNSRWTRWKVSGKSYRQENKRLDPRPDERRPRLFKFGGDRPHCSAWKLHDERIPPLLRIVRFLTAIFQRSYNSPPDNACAKRGINLSLGCKNAFKSWNNEGRLTRVDFAHFSSKIFYFLLLFS